MFEFDDDNFISLFDEEYVRLPYSDRMDAKDIMERFLIRKLNGIPKFPFELRKEEERKRDIDGIDAVTVKKYGGIFLDLQIKKRFPGSGDDLGIELIKVWPPIGIMDQDPVSIAKDKKTGGRDVKFSSHGIILIDTKWNVYIFDTNEAVKKALSMFERFVSFYRSSCARGEDLKLLNCTDGDVRIWRDKSVDFDYKGKNYPKCGAYIKPDRLKILFQGKIT